MATSKLAKDKRGVNRNLLRNWYFAGGGSAAGILPVNDRGQTTYSGPAYAYNGWYVRGVGVASLTADGVQFTSPNENDYKGLTQSITDIRSELVGKTVTISILVKDYNMSSHADYPKVGIYAANSATTNTSAILTARISGNGLITATGVIPESVMDYNSLNFSAFYVASGSTMPYGSLTIVAAKVELGDTQTLAHLENGVWIVDDIPRYAEEQAKSQTNNSDSSDITANWVNVFGRVNSSGKPYLRMFDGTGGMYQWVVAANNQLLIQKTLDNGSTWTTIASYDPVT